MNIFLKIVFVFSLLLVSLKATGFPPNYYKLPLAKKKKYFFEYFIGAIELENRKILKERDFIKSLLGRKNLIEDSFEYKKLQELQVKYKVSYIYDYDNFLKRIDIVPPSLALAQAATESGWGTSRFFKEANNIFGHWTYNPKIGMVPLQRQTGKKHFIRIFPTLQDSISAYMKNLNRTGAYYEFRAKRKVMRLKKEFIDGMKLAKTMTKYSGIGHNYVKILQSIIRKNHLAHYDKEFFDMIRNDKMLNLH